ncbi:hypothetical protein [Tenacibaculum jejuense]|uniref:Uncharacterized protein n=1 Tax=Tenacibaculum jejuense TaxID=584609 RepID=A0A238UET7_9FLAO|nr:hypothetical protein [Tenacibaculum jejuense]SNR17717.1 protein of unknown function [Tenacibaculum jejuense]
MVKLNEYLGSIASSIAEARLVSDLKSLEVAEQFAKHDLLKHFSIPRFKAENIELTIPVAIAETGQDDTTTTYVASVTNKTSLRNVTIEVLQDRLPYKKNVIGDIKGDIVSKDETAAFPQEIKPTEDIVAFDDVQPPREESLAPPIKDDVPDYKIAELENFINQEIVKLDTNLKLGLSIEKELSAYAERAVRAFTKVYPIPPYVRVDLIGAQNAVSQKIKSYVKSAPVTDDSAAKAGPRVIVEGHKLRELPPENIVQIKMTLKEESLEWYASENEEGNVSNKLLPE